MGLSVEQVGNYGQRTANQEYDPPAIGIAQAPKPGSGEQLGDRVHGLPDPDHDSNLPRFFGHTKKSGGESLTSELQVRYEHRKAQKVEKNREDQRKKVGFWLLVGCGVSVHRRSQGTSVVDSETIFLEEFNQEFVFTVYDQL